MIRRACLLLGLLTGSLAWAEAPDPPPAETPAPKPAPEAKKPVPANPLVIGADGTGGLGAKLNLDKVETFGVLDYTDKNGHGWTATPFWGAKANGTWSSQAQAHNNADMTLTLGCIGAYETVSEQVEHDLGLAYEFKGQRGTFDTPPAAGASGSTTQTLNEYLYGPQLIYRLRAAWLNDLMGRYSKSLGVPPTLIVGYFRKGGTTEALPLPEQLRADELYAQVRFSVPIPLPKSNAFLLSVLAQQSRPMQGADRSYAHFINATLTFNKGGKVQPAVSYQSGVKDGLKYDPQLLLGLLWDLTGLL